MTPHYDASLEVEAGRRLGVVVVEPVPEIMDRIRTVLSKHSDFEVLVEAVTADQALGEMRQLRHRLGVVAVVSMTLSGEHDAVWLIRAIRRNYPTFPVIACGLTADPDTISYALFAGADGFVGLGVKAGQFVATLRKAAGRGQGEVGEGEAGPLIVVPGEELEWPQEGIPLEEVEPPAPEVVRPPAAEPPPVEDRHEAAGATLADRLSRLFAGRRRREPAAGPRLEAPPTVEAPPTPPQIPPAGAEAAPAPVEAAAPVEAPPLGPPTTLPPPPAPEAPAEVLTVPSVEPEPAGAEPAAPEPGAVRELEAVKEPPAAPEPEAREELEAEAAPVEAGAAEAPEPEVAEVGAEAWEEAEAAVGAAEAVEEEVAEPAAEAVEAEVAETAAEAVEAEAAEEELEPVEVEEEAGPVEVEEEAGPVEVEEEAGPVEVEEEAGPAPPRAEEREPALAEGLPVLEEVQTAEDRSRELLQAIPPVAEPAAAAPASVREVAEGPAAPVRVVTVGTPQEFRDQVAAALGLADPTAVEWVPTATAAEELLLHSDRPVEVLVVAPKVKEADAFGLAEMAMRTSPATTVIFAREGDRERIAPRAMRAGVRDVVDLTLGAEDLRDALDRAVAWAVSLRSTRALGRRDEDQALGSVISVFSSKGGTGKTFLTANLGLAIAERTGEDVALFDLDFVMGDLFAYFGQEPDRTIEELLEVGNLTDLHDIRAAGTKLADRVWGYAALPDLEASPAAQDVSRVLRALRRAFPYVVVDASTDYSDRALEVFDASEAICLVTGLDIVGARHLSVDLETLRRLHLPREKMRIVLNRADAKVGLDRSAVERALKVSVDAAIPSSPLVPTSVNRGRPLYLDEPDSDVAKRLAELADRLVSGAAEGPRRRRRFKLL